jgi:hypothetical protein
LPSLDDAAVARVKPKLLACLTVICTVGIIVIGYLF